MQRENRYIVIKEADAKNILGPLNYKLLHTIADSIERGRSIKGKAPLECVVVESDWPEYEPLWKAIEARVDGVKGIRQQHAEWSNATFGNVGPVGPLKHLAKEACEAAAAPDDLLDWADMQFLLWDAQRRAGITDEQMIEAMERKLPILKARKWPEPKDCEPRFHIKIES
ncbi:DUF550 domain-containing protein [Serratia sp. JSRIV001]|nr:DUF550 domain-containing protein [Serratia sp. JSRIV001]UAN53813.1 DUF550 domain-containing protein [Serratia sp. JSRIV002]UAN65138.1 DUF550 domain-containing protein [Serratia sp. JSRIV006]